MIHIINNIYHSQQAYLYGTDTSCKHVLFLAETLRWEWPLLIENVITN